MKLTNGLVLMTLLTCAVAPLANAEHGVQHSGELSCPKVYSRALTQYGPFTTSEVCSDDSQQRKDVMTMAAHRLLRKIPTLAYDYNAEIISTGNVHRQLRPSGRWSDTMQIEVAINGSNYSFLVQSLIPITVTAVPAHGPLNEDLNSATYNTCPAGWTHSYTIQTSCPLGSSFGFYGDVVLKLFNREGAMVSSLQEAEISDHCQLENHC